MSLYFITGNKNKFEEAKAILPDLEQMDVDLPEIQEIDPKEIIKAKLEEALKHHKGFFIVEDTSLYINALNGLPGPLIKWFMKTMGNNGLANLAQKLGNPKAQAKTIIGYATDDGNVHFFEGSISGEIVFPQGDTNFGWDPIFKPDGYDVTFAEISKEEKNKISMRKQAIQKLKEFIG
jgi:inosine triphosphate pyrophosphatase